MDKYTIDLDQVLNDFEYLELTDPQSQNVSDQPQTSNTLSPIVTKHSINNVFHSLNEYLNTSITNDDLPTTHSQSHSENTNNIDNNSNDKKYEDIEGNKSGTDRQLIIDQKNIISKIKGEDITPSRTEVPPNERSDKSIENNLENKILEFSDSEELIKNLNEQIDCQKYNKTNKESCLPVPFDHNTILTSSLDINKLVHLSSDTRNYIDTFNTNDEPLEVINQKDDVKTENSNFSEMENNVNFTSSTNNTVNIENLGINNAVEPSNNYSPLDVLEENLEINKILDPSLHLEKSNNNSLKQDTLIDIEKISDSSIDNNSSNDQSNIDMKEKLANNINPIGHAENSQDIEPLDFVEDKLNNHLQNQQEQPIIDLDKNTMKNEILAVQIDSSTYPDISKNIQPVGFSSDIIIDEKELTDLLENLELEVEEDDTIIHTTNSNEENYGEQQNVTLINDNVNNIVDNLSDNEVGEDTDIDKKTEILEFIEEQKCDTNSLENCDIEHTDTDKKTKKFKPVEEQNYDAKSLENYDTEHIDTNQKTERFEHVEEQNYDEKSSETCGPEDRTLVVDSEKIEDNNQDFVDETSNFSNNCDISVEEQKISSVISDHPQELMRPQDLRLNNEIKEDGKGITRKIDLIGDPGSTPYNNVYINQSIEPKDAHYCDSDNSTSASPTFSECSAESTTTTASTVSLDDNNDIEEKQDTITPSKPNDSKSQADGNVLESDSLTKEQVTVEANVSDCQIDENPSNETVTNAEVESPPNNIVETGGGDGSFLDKSWLGKEAPLWIPDSDADACLHCGLKFTVIKRRHHCRACGLVLCAKCCNLKFRLEYLNAEARVCNKCFDILSKDTNSTSSSGHNTPASGNSPAMRPNPNNPLEYCSTVSPLQQVGQAGAAPPSVMVPVGVLKRKGSNKKSNKSVMFCDGIAPGSDLTHLDQDFNYSDKQKTGKQTQDTVKKKEKTNSPANVKASRNQSKVDHETGCYIPKSETNLPPTIKINKSDILYSECTNSPDVVKMLKNEALTFAINQNLFVHVKIIDMNCCMKKFAWCFSTEGLINVGCDEIVYLLEYIEDESFVPKDLFFHIQNIYVDAVNGSSIKELGISLHNTSRFLDSKNHAGFVYIKPFFQCLDNIIIPKEPYLLGILFHRWETPWAKLFPLRLIFRLGAEYRYYPTPIISTRYRESVFVEIGHTIINILADFRNFTYTLPQIRGLVIHVEQTKSTIMIPKNRYDQVIKSINNSSEHILALAGNFSPTADSHLVCIQDTQGHENAYTTHSINILDKPRLVTGASFVVLNGSLRESSGLSAKITIVEDGIMIHISQEELEKIRDCLRNIKDYSIPCGLVAAPSNETFNIKWVENDTNFNVGVKSPVDSSDMKGAPSIRVHNGKDYFCNNGTRLIRWTEVFILQNAEENSKNQDPLDVSKVSESIAKACCTALVKYLDLLVSNSCQKIGIRTTLHVENVSYSAGSNGLKLPPIYMRSLDNELIPVLHKITTNNLGGSVVVLELIFRILNS